MANRESGINDARLDEELWFEIIYGNRRNLWTTLSSKHFRVFASFVALISPCQMARVEPRKRRKHQRGFPAQIRLFKHKRKTADYADYADRVHGAKSRIAFHLRNQRHPRFLIVV